MERLVTPPRRGTSPTWGPPPPCEQALKLSFLRLTTCPETKHCFLLRNTFLLLLWWLFDGEILFLTQELFCPAHKRRHPVEKGSRIENGEIRTSPCTSHHHFKRKKCSEPLFLIQNITRPRKQFIEETYLGSFCRCSRLCSGSDIMKRRRHHLHKSLH